MDDPALSLEQPGAAQYADVPRPSRPRNTLWKRTSMSFGGSAHSFAEEEKVGFVDYINGRLAGDPSCLTRVPIDPHSMDILNSVKDGVVLCKLINALFPEKLDMAKVVSKVDLNTFEKLENLNYCLRVCKELKLSLVNIGAEDLMAGTLHLVFGLIWQIIKAGLLSKVNVDLHPELRKMMLEGEEIESLTKMHPETLLLRWVNWHLKNAGSGREISNFTTDVADSEIYVILLNQLAPEVCGIEALQQSNLLERAETMLENAGKLGCRKFVTPPDVVNGNYRLNLAFLANLFHEGKRFEARATDQLAQKLQGLQRRHSLMRRTKESAEQERERALKELEEARLQRDEALSERNEAVADKEHAALEVLDATRQRDLARGEMNTALMSLDDAKQERDAAARAAADALRDRENALAEKEAALQRAQDAESAAERARLEAEAAVAAARLGADKTSEETLIRVNKEKADEVAQMKASARDWYAKQTLEKEEAVKKSQQAELELRKQLDDQTRLAARLKGTVDKLTKEKADLEANSTLGKDEEIQRLRQQMEAMRLKMEQEHELELEQQRQQLLQQSNLAIAELKQKGRMWTDLQVQNTKDQAREELAQQVAQLKQQSFAASQATASKKDEEIAGLKRLLSEQESSRKKGEQEALKKATTDVARLQRDLATLHDNLENVRAAIRVLRRPTAGWLIKYGQRDHTWNRRLFQYKTNVLVYYHEDGRVGDVIDMDGSKTYSLKGTDKSTTNKHTYGWNKPTAFAFEMTSRDRQLQCCAVDEDEEQRWVHAANNTQKAWAILSKFGAENKN